MEVGGVGKDAPRPIPWHLKPEQGQSSPFVLIQIETRDKGHPSSGGSALLPESTP